MSEQPCERVAIAKPDLHGAAALVLARFQTAGAEQLRISRVGKLLSAAAELHRALGEYTHYAMVDHRGTHGSNDLTASTEALYRALKGYASELRELNGEFRDPDDGSLALPNDSGRRGAIEVELGIRDKRIRSA